MDFPKLFMEIRDLLVPLLKAALQLLDFRLGHIAGCFRHSTPSVVKRTSA